jgi:hypothetical protein
MKGGREGTDAGKIQLDTSSLSISAASIEEYS